MKRKKNLYKEIYNISNIIDAYDEVCRNTKNKKKVNRFKEYRCMYISRIYSILKEKNYVVGTPNIFTIYEPKERRIISQSMQDKVINHLIARHILYPAILPCLLDVNVASRKNLGTSKGLDFANKFHKICKIKYGNYFILKCDVSKFFSSINHDILKEKVSKRIKDADALKIVFDVIDSEPQGLGIGAMTSQILAIFYLNDLDHFIKEVLKISCYVRYQDDFLLFHESKEYLEYCLEQIKEFLKKEKLTLNAKTRIYKNTDNFLFLGRNTRGNYSRYRTVKRKIKKQLYLYKMGYIELNQFLCSLICYKSVCQNRLVLPNQFFGKLQK